MIQKKVPTALIILDGFGYNELKEGNAMLSADIHNFLHYRNEYPHTLLCACGKSVGLPDGQMGSSEVGHQNIGAGRVVPQELWRINSDIESGVFLDNPQFPKMIRHCKIHNSALHFLLLASHGGVHSELNHLYELLKYAKAQGLTKVYIHCITDGRDTKPDEARKLIAEAEGKIREIGVGKIATVQGRFYIMDRDDNFDRLQKGYDLIVRGIGTHFATADEAISHSYENEVLDEFIEPSVIDGARFISDNDALFFCNFRPDRAKSIMKMLIYNDSEMKSWYKKADEKKAESARAEHKRYTPLPYLDNKNRPKNLFIVAMAEYDASINDRMHIAYHKKFVPMSIGHYLSSLGYTQLRIAETEKYSHVTSFFSGNRDEKFDGEERIVISSPSVKSYDMKPEMSAYEVCETCIKCIESGAFDFIVLNFANPDMVGHTGNFEATVAALNAVDICLGHVAEAILREGGKLCITADHGNADEMIDKKGKPSKNHSLNPVPFILVDPQNKNVKLKGNGALCNIAPTLLDIMGIEPPKEFEAESLIIHEDNK